MHRSRSSAAAGVLALLAACSDGSGGPPPGDLPPSVLLVVVDTLRADHLGCYGYERDTSPFLDELARRSVLFEWCLTQWPKTGPAMAALFSSTYGSRSGVARKTGIHPVPRSYDLVAEVLRDAGYQTLAAVSNGSLRTDLHYDQGFEVYRENFTHQPGSADLIAADARELLSGRDRSRPYFLWVHFIDPHTPYEPPPRYHDLFLGDATYEADRRGPAPIEPIENTMEEHRPWKDASITGIPLRYHVEGQDELRYYVARYDAEIRYVDDTLRELFRWMEEEGHRDEDTVLVFTSDHGEALGDHGYYFEHGRYPYDDCTRVPLVIHHPDWPPAVVSTPFPHLDLVPTLLDSLGLEPGWQSQGTSWVACLRGELPLPEEAPVFTESGFREEFSVALRLGPWKMITTPDAMVQRELRKGPYQLYRVTEDPDETRDLMELETAHAARLRPILEAFREEAYRRVANPDNRTEEVPGLSEEERRHLLELGYLQEAEARPDDPDEAPKN